jgi:hypothetical protein
MLKNITAIIMKAFTAVPVITFTMTLNVAMLISQLTMQDRVLLEKVH